MKRLILGSINGLLAAKSGTAGPANKRQGIIKFGSGQYIDMENGWRVLFPTGVCRVNLNSLTIDNYINIFIERKDNIKGARCFKEWTGLTQNEASELIQFLFNASQDELDKLFVVEGYLL